MKSNAEKKKAFVEPAPAKVEPKADGTDDAHLTRTGKVEKRLEHLAEVRALKELYGE